MPSGWTESAAIRDISVRSTRPQELIDITDRLAELARAQSCSALLVYVPHTTAGVLINEHADPDVAHDMLLALDRLVPAGAPYRHAEGNSPSHIKATLVGTSQLVPVENGRLALGTWQGVFFAEFDGPRNRRVIVVPVSGPRD